MARNSCGCGGRLQWLRFAYVVAARVGFRFAYKRERPLANPRQEAIFDRAWIIFAENRVLSSVLRTVKSPELCNAIPDFRVRHRRVGVFSNIRSPFAGRRLPEGGIKPPLLGPAEVPRIGARYTVRCWGFPGSYFASSAVIATVVVAGPLSRLSRMELIDHPGCWTGMLNQRDLSIRDDATGRTLSREYRSAQRSRRIPRHCGD